MKIMNDDIYKQLAEYLDKLPDGFLSNDINADIQLLKRLFTPEEAKLAVHLTLDREGVKAIAERAKLPIGEVEGQLKEMAHKGLIFSIEQRNSETLYQAAPFVIGIYEFQVNRLNKGLLRDLAYHWRAMDEQINKTSVPQTRIIPVGKNLDPHLEVLSYEQVNEIVKSKKEFTVAPCICRRTAKMMGGGCDAPEESCLVFDEWAEFYVRDGRARKITRAEVYAILERADQANLVLQPSNSRDASFICCCCGCCCGILSGLKNHPKPAEAVASSFIATLDDDLCTGCWVCLERCQMDALSEDGSKVALNQQRCIGCGLCTTTCPSGALTLIRKEQKQQKEMPDTMGDTWRVISRAQN